MRSEVAAREKAHAEAVRDGYMKWGRVKRFGWPHGWVWTGEDCRVGKHSLCARIKHA